jgi:putative FmdB family regulatory protein
MPTYEYKCLECQRRSEAFQSMTDEPLKTCEVCGGKLKRLIGTGAGLIFKGSGFYCTDYRSSSYQQAAKTDKESSSSKSESTSTKSPEAPAKAASAVSKEGKST